MINVKNLVLGIGIVIIFGLLLWQGIEAFYPSPQWDDYCGDKERTIVDTEAQCVALDGRWTPYLDKTRGDVPVPVDGPRIDSGYCDLYFTCQEEYDDARDSYSQIVFIVSLIVGIIVLFVGYGVLSVEPVGSALIGGGIWAIFWGSAINWRNFSSVWRFVLLLIAFVFIIWITLRLNSISKEKKKGLLRRVFGK